MSYDDLTIRRIMIEDACKVLPKAPAIRAAQTMVQARIRHLVAAESTGEVVGVISQRQILKHFSPWLSEVHKGNEPETPFPRCEVRDIMSQPPVTVTANTSIRVAAAIMASKKIGCLPVVKARRQMIGLVTATDLLKFVGANRLPVPDEEFHVFRPPAFLKEGGDITVPIGHFPELEPEKEVLAVLAYNSLSKRIGIRLLTRESEGAELSGARPARVTDKHVVVPAADFLQHHSINIRGSLEVAEDNGTGFLVLSPTLEP